MDFIVKYTQYTIIYYTICVVSVIQFVDLPVMEVHPVL